MPPARKKKTNNKETVAADGANAKSPAKRGAKKVDSQAEPPVKKARTPAKKKEEKVDPADVEYLKELDFSSTAKTKDGKDWNKKFISLNVNGFRAFVKKGGIEYLLKEDADIYCLQETKCTAEEAPIDGLKEAGYSCHFASAEKAGYSGCAMIYKKEPISIVDGIGVAEHDDEGRTITMEYEDFYLVTSYVPNSGRGLVRLDYRTKEWDVAFREYIVGLDKKKTVVLCGDLNVAHEEIDLKNPKPNKNKTAGFCDGEREGMTALLDAGFLDSFRHLNPEQTGAYTFWSFMGNSRAKNVGWRLDYFLISKRMEGNLCDSFLRQEVKGSDHCPIGLLLTM